MTLFWFPITKKQNKTKKSKLNDIFLNKLHVYSALLELFKGKSPDKHSMLNNPIKTYINAKTIMKHVDIYHLQV